MLVTPFCRQKEKRKKMKGRMKYEAPLAQVRGIFLEGLMADSYNPVIGAGDIKYNEYEAVAGTQDCDILLF